MRKSSPSTARRASLRSLPSVDRLLHAPAVRSQLADLPHHMQVELAREVLDDARVRVLAGEDAPSVDELAQAVQQAAEQRALPSLRPLINATGVVLHTNLGRAPLCQAAVEAMQAVSAGYSNLELNLETGTRGSRYDHLADALVALTGAEDALAVNNNAAAILLVLSTLAAGNEVIVSRGEAVEIGGGFRIPDVLAQSGARLVEVGTTNRTYVEDYVRAITPATGAILRVHSSNFRVVGFTHAADSAELAAAAHQHDIPVIYDLGSGSLLDTAVFGLHREPTVQETIAAGCAVVCFSGDKLLGGPQGGLIVGQGELIASMKRHPLARALRLEKATIAGLEATLAHYRKQDAPSHIPVWQMISEQPERLKRRARNWQRALDSAHGRQLTTAIEPSESTIGGGALPGATLPTWVLRFSAPARSADWLAGKLRASVPPVVARIEEESVVLDPRTVLPKQDQALKHILKVLPT